MLNAVFIEEAFKLINFAIVVGFVVYYIKTKMLDNVRDQIRQKELFEQNLATNSEHLLQQIEQADKDFISEKQYANQLLEKIAAWHKQVDEQNQKQKARAEACYTQAVARRTEQQEYTVRAHTVRALVPDTIASLAQQLEREYSNDPQKADRYIQKVLNRMGDK